MSSRLFEIYQNNFNSILEKLGKTFQQARTANKGTNILTQNTIYRFIKNYKKRSRIKY
jgi:hypothetical protein